MTAGEILGNYARIQREKADLLENENQSLLKQVEKLTQELKISADALYAMAAPRTDRPLNTIKPNLELPSNS
jgi:hypothetical protein